MIPNLSVLFSRFCAISSLPSLRSRLCCVEHPSSLVACDCTGPNAKFRPAMQWTCTSSVAVPTAAPRHCARADCLHVVVTPPGSCEPPAKSQCERSEKQLQCLLYGQADSPNWRGCPALSNRPPQLLEPETHEISCWLRPPTIMTMTTL